MLPLAVVLMVGNVPNGQCAMSGRLRRCDRTLNIESKLAAIAQSVLSKTDFYSKFVNRSANLLLAVRTPGVSCLDDLLLFTCGAYEAKLFRSKYS